MDIKKTLSAANLQVGEFAVLCGVSRVAVHSWCKGERINPLRQPRVEKLLEAIKSATKAKDFPITRPSIRGVDKMIVMAKIKTVILKHLGTVAKAR